MFTFRVALRFLTSNKSQTLLIVLGIGIGLSVNIFVGSLIQSLQDDLIQTTVGTRPHITISSLAEDGYIDEWQEIDNELAQITDITKIVTSIDITTFIMNLNLESPDVVLLRGFDLNQANDLYDFYNSETFTGTKPQSDNEIIVGSSFIEEMELAIGQTLVLKSDPNPTKPSVNVTISGVFDLGNEAVNNLWIIGNQQLPKNVGNLTDQISAFNLQVKDIFAADIIATQITEILKDDSLEVVNWKDTNESLLTGLEAQAQSTNIIQSFVLMAVVIGIASILSITVLQKQRQIGILKAMGLTNIATAKIFVFQGLILGFIGSVIGMMLGFFLLWSFNSFAGGDGGLLFEISIYPNLVLITVTVAITFSVLASLIPARSSSKMEVIDIIRNN